MASDKEVGRNWIPGNLPDGSNLPLGLQKGQALSDAAFEGDTPKIVRGRWYFIVQRLVLTEPLEQAQTVLLAAGIPIDSRDKEGFTALHRSCVTGNAAVVQFLVDNKADVNVEDTYGDSPMHYACFCGHVGAVTVLLKAGGDPNKRSKDGKTPLRSAEEEGHVAIVSLITAHNAARGSSASLSGAPATPGAAVPAFLAAGGGATAFALTPDTAGSKAGGASAAKGGGTKGLTTAGSVAGLDFTTGVIMEGDLGKKRKNKMLKWRRKYYVLSRTYGALFFWTGTRDRVDGVIKKVRFETLLSVVHHPDKQGGKRFDLRVVTGRTMMLLAATTNEARLWVTTLHSVVGKSMAAIRIQSAWRRYRAQRTKRKLLAERSEAVARLATAAGGTAMNALGGLLKTPARGTVTSASKAGASGGTASGSPHIVHGAIKSEGKGTAVLLSAEGILVEGELKKKNSSGVGSLLSAFRTRYFVLHQHDAALYYFETRAQRHAGVRPRAVPVLSFYSVRHDTDRKGNRTCSFELRVVSGRSFAFEARSVAVAENWVRFLNAVLPRQHVAALKIQRTYKRHKAVRLLKKLRAERKLAQAAPPPAAGGKAASGGAAPGASPWVKYVHTATGRDYWHNPATKETLWTDPTVVPIGDWLPTKDPASGRTYYFNQKTKQTSWETPVVQSAAAAAVSTSAAKPRSRARWIKKADEASGREFFANVDTHETSWSRPAGLDDGSARLVEWFSKEPPGGGRKFYVHAASNRTQWERPEGYASDDEAATAPAPGPAAAAAAAPVLPPPPPLPVAATAAATAAAPAAAAAVLPPPPPQPVVVADASTAEDWSEIKDPEGGPSYFYNAVTGESVWERPAAMARLPPPPPPPPPPTSAAAVQAALHKKKTLGSAAPAASSSKLPVSGTRESRSSVSWGGGLGGAGVVVPGGAAPKMAASGGGGGPRLQRSISTRVVGTSSGLGALGDAGKGGGAAATASAADPDGWRQSVDSKSNRPFFFNVLTGESMWERPAPGGAQAASVAAPDAGEIFSFGAWLNEQLAGDAELSTSGLVPVASAAPGAPAADVPLFAALRNGVVACRLVNAVARDTVDMRAVDRAAAPGSAAATDNCRLALAAAQSVGCLFTKDVTPTSLSAGEPQPVLDFLWQLFKLQVLAPVSVRNQDVPGIVLLAGEDEALEDLLRLRPEALLLRWLNFQIAAESGASAAPASPPLRDFGAALADGVALCGLMRSVSSAALTSGVPPRGAAAAAPAALQAVLKAAAAMGVPRWFSAEGLASGNIRLQLAFVASVFRAAPSMPDPAAAAAHAAAPTAAAGGGKTPAKPVTHVSALRTALHARLATEDREGDRQSLTREARTVAQWVNTLDIEGVALHGQSIGQELRDGVGLLKVLDVVEPGLVKWGRVNGRPTNRYKMVENCNYAVTLGRAMDFHLVNMSGLDLVDANAKLLLAYMWQLMRYHTLKQLSTLAFNGFTADEAEVLAWANTQVSAAVVASGQPAEAATRISSFADPELATGIFLLYLLNSVRPGCVNWDVVLDGDSREQQEANARYVISTARRLDITVLCSWEDIADVKPRAMVLLVAALMVADSAARKAAEGGSAGGVAAALAALEERDDGSDDDA